MTPLKVECCSSVTSSQLHTLLTFAAKRIQSPVNYSEWDSGGIRKGGKKHTKSHSKRLREKCQRVSMGAYLTQQDSDVTGNKRTSVLWFKNKLIHIQSGENMLQMGYMPFGVNNVLSPNRGWVTIFGLILWFKKVCFVHWPNLTAL